KLTSRSLLHRIIPTLVTSAKFSICRYHDESSVHLLFACPLKMRVWRLAWQKHLAAPFDSIQDVISSFTSWSWLPYVPVHRPSQHLSSSAPFWSSSGQPIGATFMMTSPSPLRTSLLP
ncbi:hypothetical protein DM01DRAFT_1391885, partial [Hesseltinella vesiculosa]